MLLNAHPLSTLDALASADVLVLATSSLSNLAALLNKGLKLYNSRTVNAKPNGPLHSTVLHTFIQATPPREWLVVSLPTAGSSSSDTGATTQNPTAARFFSNTELLRRVKALYIGGV